MGTSSDRGSICSDETRRTSLSDEAQTSFNVLVILRNDTQHLISLRNENLDALEDRSGLIEDDVSSRTALLACINESITAATRSITQLGPFLDKHRWPSAVLPTTPESQRRSFTISLKPRRRRSKNSSGLATSPNVAQDGESLFTPEELFSWTLTLTAQHTAVLVAMERLRTFLESGVANVSEEEKRRRDARASWWDQGRGEFENVGLIQSLLSRPKRTFGETSAETSAAVATSSTKAKAQEDDDEGQNLTPIIENDDGRSETLISEAFTPSTLTTTPKGLTARPRYQPTGSLQHDEGVSVHLVCTTPLSSSLAHSQSSKEARLSRMETFGSAKPPNTLTPSNSSEQRPQIPTSSSPSTGFRQNALPRQHNRALEQDRVFSATMGLPSDVDRMSAGVAQPHAHIRQTTAPFTPRANPENINAPQMALASLKNNRLTEVSPPPSPVAETVYTPYMPLSPNNAGLFDQRALNLPSSESLRPSIRDLGRIIISPDQGAENVALRVSPIETKYRVSIAPLIEGPDSTIVSPVETELDLLSQPLHGVSPVTIAETHDRVSQDDAGGYMAWLGYMERKREVCASRWSLKRAKTSQV